MVTPHNPSPGPTGPKEAEKPRVAIVDQLSISNPNQTFLRSVTSYFEHAGYAVDLFKWQEVTVDFYRSLGLKAYAFIIFRVHSNGMSSMPGMPVFLFTSENYTTSKYVVEQLTDQVIAAKPFYEGAQTVFAIGPSFIRRSMMGNLQDAIVILSGCFGMLSADLPSAFIERGARLVIGWNRLVDPRRTDSGIDLVLHGLLVERLSVCQAVLRAMEMLGPDATYGSELQYYPSESGELRVTLEVIPTLSCSLTIGPRSALEANASRSCGGRARSWM
jgi:hypothetical protein